MILDLISSAKVFIFTKHNCQYCDKLKTLLDEIHVQYKCYEVTDDNQSLKSDIISLTNHRTFPQLFINSNFIGGYSEVSIFAMTNYLYKLLDEAYVSYKVEF